MKRITLDYHGFRRMIAAPVAHRAGDTVSVPISPRLSAFPFLHEERLAVEFIAFRTLDGKVYRCAGCLHCDPDRLHARMHQMVQVEIANLLSVARHERARRARRRGRKNSSRRTGGAR